MAGFDTDLGAIILRPPTALEILDSTLLREAALFGRDWWTNPIKKAASTS
jgi:hypothetical protein